MSAELLQSGRPSQEAPDEQSSPPPAPASFVCDACGRTYCGTPAGSGLFLWSRGDEVRYEEPPLCEECALGVSLRALGFGDWEEEEG